MHWALFLHIHVPLMLATLFSSASHCAFSSHRERSCLHPDGALWLSLLLWSCLMPTATMCLSFCQPNKSRQMAAHLESESAPSSNIQAEKGSQQWTTNNCSSSKGYLRPNMFTAWYRKLKLISLLMTTVRGVYSYVTQCLQIYNYA